MYKKVVDNFRYVQKDGYCHAWICNGILCRCITNIRHQGESMDKQEIKTARTTYVAKDNELIQTASYKMTAEEQKLLCYVISKIKPSDKPFQRYTISALDFAEVCGIDKRHVYTDFKEIIDSLDNHSRWIQLGDDTVKFRVFYDASYNERQGSLTVMLNDRLHKHLLNLVEMGGNYTQYELWNVLSLKSKFSIRLYELFRSYAYQSKKEFDLDKLRGLLCVENYAIYAEFKRRVLDKAIEEINQYTDLKVSFKPIHQGKEHKVVSVVFYITRKEQNEKISAYWKTVNRLNKKNGQLPGQMSIFNYDLEKEIGNTDQPISVTKG